MVFKMDNFLNMDIDINMVTDTAIGLDIGGGDVVPQWIECQITSVMVPSSNPLISEAGTNGIVL